MPKKPSRSFELIELRKSANGKLINAKNGVSKIVKTTVGPGSAAEKLISRLCRSDSAANTAGKHPRRTGKKECRYLVTIAELETTDSGKTKFKYKSPVRMVRKNGDQKFFSYTGRFVAVDNPSHVLKGPDKTEVTHRFKPKVLHHDLSASLLNRRGD